MSGGIAHTMALLAAVALMVVVSTIREKIHNPSPPPPEGPADMAGEQGKHASGGEVPRGDVDHVQSGSYIPPEPPDILYASRVGWYEDDPERPGHTHVHWVPRAEWEAAQEEPDRRPGWLRVLWP